MFQNTQSRLQKGCTPGCSSLSAALTLSECVLESTNKKRDLFLTTLDTQKAFDVVDQNYLPRKLYLDGIHGKEWLLLKELYSDCSSRIKWAGELSHHINIKQGVRQGGVLTTGHYKRYNSPLLLPCKHSLWIYSGPLSAHHYPDGPITARCRFTKNASWVHLENTYAGFKIVSISIPLITVTDDLALMTENKAEMQVLVWDVENSASCDRFYIHPTKSHILWHTYHKKKDLNLDTFLAGDKVDVTDTAVHLGIVRNTCR